MRACRVCGRLFPEDARFCPVDGRELHDAEQVSASTADGAGRVGEVILGRYQLRRVVADGGMGRVYEALDRIGQRHVAVKVLHPEVARDPVAVERFKREFRVSRALSSPHVVEVLDFSPTEGDSHALVMEFLRGEELRSTLRRERFLPPERVVRLLSQVALALDAAHDESLVHRDLKPDNLFLCQTSDGDVVKLLDFGSVRDNAESAKKLTVMGTTIGSPYYMSPEQAQGLEVLDGRADVWALGVIAYECLTGEVPFKGVNGPSTLLEILTKEPDPPSLVPSVGRADIPASVDAAILRALAKSVEERTASAGQLAVAVGRGYGLDGGHTDWAVTTEPQLGRLIAARLPSLMEHSTVPRAAALPQRGPRGPALAASSSARPSSRPARPSPSAPVAALAAPPAASVLPSRPPWVAPAVVALAALVAGVVLTLLFV